MRRVDFSLHGTGEHAGLAGEAVLPHFAGDPLSLPQLSGGLKQPVEGAIQGGDAGHVHVSGKTAAPESRPPNARATEKT